MSKTVKDIMHSGENNAVVERDCLFRDVLIELDKKKLGVVNVVNDNVLIGIITDGDIRRMILNTQHSLPELFVTNIDKMMTNNPASVHPDNLLSEALNVLKENRFWVLPVVDERMHLVGTIHMHDLLKEIII